MRGRGSVVAMGLAAASCSSGGGPPTPDAGVLTRIVCPGFPPQYQSGGVKYFVSPAGTAAFFCSSPGQCHALRVVGNHLHHIGRICTDVLGSPGAGGRGFSIDSPNVLVEGNLFHDIGRFAPGENGCAPTTTNYQNHD